MKRILAVAFLLAGCQQVQPGTVPSAFTTQGGQVFCAIQQAGGGQIVVGLVDATTAAYAPVATPGVAIGAAVTKAYLDSNCAAAAAKLGGTTTGAVPAPAMPVQTVAITPISTPPVLTPAAH